MHRIYQFQRETHIFLDNFHQGGKYIAQIESHHEELRREEKIIDQKYLSITSLQIDYLNLDSSSGYGINNERENIVHTKCTFMVVLTIIKRNF